MSEERRKKILSLIGSLPVEEQKALLEEAKKMGEVSTKVEKLLKVFNQLSDEEKEQFTRMAMPPKDLTPNIPDDELFWEIKAIIKESAC